MTCITPRTFRKGGHHLSAMLHFVFRMESVKYISISKLVALHDLHHMTWTTWLASHDLHHMTCITLPKFRKRGASSALFVFRIKMESVKYTATSIWLASHDLHHITCITSLASQVNQGLWEKSLDYKPFQALGGWIGNWITIQRTYILQHLIVAYYEQASYIQNERVQHGRHTYSNYISAIMF